MSYFLKFAIITWVTFSAWALLGHYLGSGIMVISAVVLIIGIVVYTRALGHEKRAKNRAEAAEFWNRPWWQCVACGVLILGVPLALHDYLESTIDGQFYHIVPSAISAFIGGSFFGLFLGWHFKRQDVTAQSDSSDT